MPRFFGTDRRDERANPYSAAGPAPHAAGDEGGGGPPRGERSGSEAWVPPDAEPFAHGSDEPAPVNREDASADERGDASADEAPTAVHDQQQGEPGEDQDSQRMPWDSQ